MTSALTPKRLARFSGEFADRVRGCDTVDDLCSMVCDFASDLSPGDPIVVSLLDPATGMIRVRAYRGFGDNLADVLQLLGFDPRGTNFDPDDVPATLVPLYCSGRMERLPDGIYELLDRRVPLALCNAVQRLLGVRATHVVGFGMEERPHGGLILFSRKDTLDTVRPLIEMLAGMVSLAIRQRRADTERALLERQLHEAQKLEAVGKLAGGVAHDFNNTLQIISGIAEVLRHTLPIDHDSRELLDDLQTASSHAREVTRDLLAIGRRQQLSVEIVDLTALVRDVQRLLKRSLRPDITVSCATPPAPLYIRGDRAELQRALINLALNAQDAITGTGAITCELSADDDLVRVGVHDTGAGMPPEVARHAFEPFFTTKSQDRGSGLGLATVYGVVHQLGGQISLTSTIGEGTSFFLTFPREYDAPAATVPRPTVTFERVDPASGWVLLVDDEPLVRRPIARHLQRAGWRTLEADSGDHALLLASAEREPPRLVVTDVLMPGMTGLELIQKLRERYPTLRALTMSGYHNELTLPSPTRPAHLKKPFSLPELDATLAALFNA